MTAREYWNTLPHCCGYPDCDGDLEGEKHSAKCPLFEKEEITCIAFAEAYHSSQMSGIAQRSAEKIMAHIKVNDYAAFDDIDFIDEIDIIAAIIEQEGK